MSITEAVTAYKRRTPLRRNSTAHKDDLATIRKASRPLDKAERLVKQRESEEFIAQVDAMLFDLQGRRKRYSYSNSAAQQLKHISPHPFDPVTQDPLWRELLRVTYGRPTDRQTFMGIAIDILRQHSVHGGSATEQVNETPAAEDEQ